MSTAVQDELRGNFCWGCGADNPDGLRLKSYQEDDAFVARWQPSPIHAAGPRHVLNGGIIATLLDCHGICSAVADAYAREERPITSGPDIWYATGSLTVEYLRPTPLADTVSLEASIVSQEERITVVRCSLSAEGKERARATVRAVRVPPEWRHGEGDKSG